MAGKFVLKKGSTGKFHFNLVAGRPDGGLTAAAVAGPFSLPRWRKWASIKSARGPSGRISCLRSGPLISYTAHPRPSRPYSIAFPPRRGTNSCHPDLGVGHAGPSKG